MGVADPAHHLHYRYLREALASVPAFVPGTILDAGCGRGDHSIWLARSYPDAKVLGIDVDEGLIARNRQAAEHLGLANIAFEVRDLSRLDYVDQFDLVVSIDVLEHIREQEAALAGLTRALRPGGVAFYHIPTVRERPVPFSKHLGAFHDWAVDEHVAEEHTAPSFTAAVEQSGLDVMRSRKTFGFYTGELATSLFALPYRDSAGNRILQGVLAPLCRSLTWADPWGLERTRYAVAVLSRRPAPSVRPDEKIAP